MHYLYTLYIVLSITVYIVFRATTAHCCIRGDLIHQPMAITQSGTAAIVVDAAAIPTLEKSQLSSAAAAAAAPAATASVTAAAATAAAAAAAVTAAAVAAAGFSSSPDSLSVAPSADEAPSAVRDTIGDDTIDPNVWRIHGQDYDLSEFVNEHPGGVSGEQSLH